MTVNHDVAGSSPVSSVNTGTLAQLVEHLVEAQGVAGSNPAGSIDVT